MVVVIFIPQKYHSIENLFKSEIKETKENIENIQNIEIIELVLAKEAICRFTRYTPLKGGVLRMLNKIKRFSYNQLVVLNAFLKKRGQVVNVAYLEKTTKIKDKSLGGVISSLSRTHFRNINLIEPVGADASGSGLRWILNDRLLDGFPAEAEVKRLLNLYR